MGVRWLGGAAILILAAAAGAARAADAPAPGDEPALTGEAKEKHDKEVKEIVEDLRAGKNREVVRGKIQRLGSQATRVARDALIAFATGNKNQEFAAEAFKALAKIGGKASIEFLCGKSALRSADFLIQVEAAGALATAKSPLAVGPLLDVMTSTSSKIEVVGATALAVAQSAPNDERVVEALFALAGAGKDTIRANAVEAIGYLASDKAMAKLKDVLVNEKNARVRAAAATGMEHSGRRDMIPVLEAALKAENAFQVKDAIQRALSKLSGS